MATLLTKSRLKTLLLNISNNYSEPYDPAVALAWASIWAEYFGAASLDSVLSYSASYITDQVDHIKVGVNSLLGAGDASGSSVTVTCSLTGRSGVFTSVFGTDNYILTDDLLGQDSPDLTVTNYTIVSGLSVANISTLTGLMQSSLAGLTADDAFVGKLALGIQAWWGDMVSNPSDYFAGATAVVAPAGVTTGLESAIQAVIDANAAIIATPGTDLSAEDALDPLAGALNTANAGGYATIGGTDYTIG